MLHCGGYFMDGFNASLMSFSFWNSAMTLVIDTGLRLHASTNDITNNLTMIGIYLVDEANQESME